MGFLFLLFFYLHTVLIIPTKGTFVKLNTIPSSTNNLPKQRQSKLQAETTTTETIIQTRNKLLQTARTLRDESPSGVFLTDSRSKSELKRAVSELEDVVGTKSFSSDDTEMMIGDWTLLCTTNSLSPDSNNNNISDRWDPKEKKRTRGASYSSWLDLPSFVRDRFRKSWDVTQRIRCMTSDDDDTYDRVDNVVEYAPFDTLNEFMEGAAAALPPNPLPFDLPFNGGESIGNLNLNPLEVTKSKVALVHDAKVESMDLVLRTKISLKSIVLTVAGKSQYLDPDGADILGINFPLGEILQSGSFDTTYVDDQIRISRGTIGFLDELRVFVRKV